jgi:hypothetical protein
MKLRYFALTGLIVITVGCFLPFRFGLEPHTGLLSLFLPISGTVLLLLSKESPFGNGRIIGGIFGLLMGLLTISSILDLVSFPFASGIHIVYWGPVTILAGSILACIGGFSSISGSRNFQISTRLSLISVIIMACFLGLITFPKSLQFMISFGNDTAFIISIVMLDIPLLMIYASSGLVIKESRRAN